MKPATFDLLRAVRAIAPRTSPSGAATRLDRSQVEVLAGALLSHLDVLDAPEVGSIVRVKGDPQHGIADGTLAEVVDLEGAGFGQVTVRGYVTNRAQAWDHSDVGVQRQYVDRHLIEVVR